jgi:uncharacterized Zn finger protein (UPF0148 family)
METRGERECRDCGTRWSYYETGTIMCPSCGSLESVGRGERARHTAGGSPLDLEAVREAIDEEPLSHAAALAADAGRTYRQAAGFIDAGQLQPLDDTLLLAAELETVGRDLERAMQIEDSERAYLIELLKAPEADRRPAPDAVPTSLAPARGLAICRAVDEYVADLKRQSDDPEKALARAFSSLRANRKRIEALDGDVAPREAERLVGATRDLYAYLERDDEAALARIDERLR